MMTSRVGLCVAATFALSLATPAHAEASANVFLQRIDAGSTIFAAVLAAYANGFGWANVELQSKRLPPLYCQPGALATTMDQDTAILRAYVKQHSQVGEQPAGLVLLKAYQFTFPCGSGN